MSERRALRVSEVAAALGVASETVRRAIIRGELPARRLGNAWLVPVEGLIYSHVSAAQQREVVDVLERAVTG